MLLRPATGPPGHLDEKAASPPVKRHSSQAPTRMRVISMTYRMHPRKAGSRPPSGSG
ncbi:hypothetical protein CLV29_0743 [Naumannella halotolerans]|uniref:Uncharacterized protein n=1 Tax=Naumannella halotolerans TaxID=993414 RepID=A0A4R7J6V9_9ACTN|nr:hypothetical protein CLV29_0743 [Naumannella halotolerans]